MTDQIETAEVDDDFPPVSFSLRNMTGEAGTIELRTPMLGTELYVLITAGEDGPIVEASHLTMAEVLQILAFTLVTGLQDEENTTEAQRQEIREVLTLAEADEEAQND